MADALDFWTAQETQILETMTAQEARQCVDEIKSHISEARAMLLDLYDRKGWQALGYSNWRECVSSEFGQNQSTLYFQLQAAQIERNISNVLENNEPIPMRQLRPLASLPPTVQPIAWKTALETAPETGMSEDHVKNVVEGLKNGYQLLNNGVKKCNVCGQLWAADLPYCPYCNISREARIAYVQQERKHTAPDMAVHYSSETPEWYTPTEIIDRVVLTFGEIDLDPCSNSKSNPNIPARHHLTAEDNGLSYEWGGKVYLNPPYGREIGEWTSYLKQQYECGNVTEAIALVPSRTDTEWFRELRDYPRCFIWGRLKFSESENSAPFPSMVVYFGEGLDGFRQAFGDIGDIYTLS